MVHGGPRSHQGRIQPQWVWEVLKGVLSLPVKRGPDGLLNRCCLGLTDGRAALWELGDALCFR